MHDAETLLQPTIQEEEDAMADILAGIENEHVDGESYLTDD